MLKKIIIQNFIHFREREHLTFEDGPNYIIGGNSTGKSSIMELIRRCLSRTGSTSTSSIPVDDQLAFVLCKFELQSNISSELYSGIFVQKAIENEDRKMFKIVFKNQDVQEIFFERSVYESPGKVEKQPDFLRLKPPKNAHVKNYIKEIMKGDKIPDSSDHNPVEELLKLLNSEDDVIKCTAVESPCEKDLLPLTDSFVQVFSLRSVGPLQWNKSKRLNRKDSNYDQTDENAEILTELFDSRYVDLKIQQEIFRELTLPLEYVFNKRNGTFWVNYNGIDHRLLKTPEGVIEAMQISLILAHKNYETICYEEPGVGMHPHMIEKMRDLVLRRQYDKKKVIILISHNPSMISKWTLDRTYACRRAELPDQQISHHVIKVGCEKYCKILDRDVLKNILFASRILFVEGITDKLVMELVFEELLESRCEEDKTLQEKIIGMQIIPMSGCESKKDAADLARHLGVKIMFLLDLDKGKPRKTEISTKSVHGKLKDIDRTDSKEAANKIYKIFTEDVYTIKETPSLQTDPDVFVWKSGEIEDVLCFALLENIKESDSKEEQIDLLCKLFKADISDYPFTRSMRKPKKMKTFVLDFNKENAKQLGKYLVNSEDIKRFLEFMKSH